jgi:hypothetical protein
MMLPLEFVANRSIFPAVLGHEPSMGGRIDGIERASAIEDAGRASSARWIVQAWDVSNRGGAPRSFGGSSTPLPVGFIARIFSIESWVPDVQQ